MLTLNQIHAQIEALANAHYQIAEVGMGTLAELQAKPDRLYPLLWLSNEGGSLEDNYKVDNIRLTMFGRVISGEEGQDDDASEIEVLSDMQLILLDFLNYFHQQHAQEYVVAKSASLEHFTERTNDRTAGYSCILELKQFYDWNKCQIPESGASISPSVDGLTLYDFCDQAVIDRLTPTQVACLEDEFASTCSPAILTANSATFTTVASGGSLDIAVHDTADANVGTVASTSEIEIGNSSNEVNGVDISEPTVAEGTHNQVIQNSSSTPVGTAANPSVIGDSQAQVNGVNTETIAATVTHNQEIEDSAGGSVGTAANPSVIGDNTINFNGSDVDIVKAEETYSFLVELDSVQAGTYDAGTNTVSVTSAACADATTQVNAVNVGTVASGGTFDQQIHDSAGADVGTSANPSVVSDSAITVSGSALTSLKATQSLAIDVIDTDSNPVTATIIDADTIQVPAGSSPPSDPSSFSDANALFLGDRGLTFINNQLDDWANQGSDGSDASASATANRIGASSALGIGGFRNFQPWGKVYFTATGFSTTANSAFTFEGITSIWNSWNPGRIIPSLGSINSSNYAALCWVGSQGFRVTCKTAGTSINNYWSKANLGVEYGQPFAWTLVYDGSEAANTDRLKLYVNGVLKTQSTTPTIPTTLTNDGTLRITSSHTSYSSFAEIGGYVGYWERVLTPTEIADNQTWKEEIWAVTP